MSAQPAMRRDLYTRPRNQRPWDQDEWTWAIECAVAGDSPEEIAETAGRSVPEVRDVIGDLAFLTAKQRDLLSLYAAGCSFPDIGGELKRSWRACGAQVTDLRKRGLPIPYRCQAIVEGRAANA
jgi:DNA-binding NarL/FixJ family response regulator